jgi:hypothetical protein
MPVNESKTRSPRQWEIWDHSGALGPLKQNSLGYRRQTAGMEFRRGNANVRSFPLVREYLTRVIDDYEDRFGSDDALFEAWHKIRVAILDNFGTPDYLQKSRDLTAKFDKKYFTDPKTNTYSPDKYVRVQPVITEITHIVSRGK